MAEEVRRLRKGQVRRPRKRVITYGAGATVLIKKYRERDIIKR
jgi:hypothetical protein